MIDRCDLVLGGGGVRGLAFVGALSALEDAGIGVERVAGASAGAIAGALAVAGVPPATIRRLTDDLDLRGFALAGVVSRLRDARGVGDVVGWLAPTPTDPEQWLTEVLADHGIETFADLRTDAPDDAPIEERYRLVVRCLDVVQRRVVRLPWDYRRYGLDPDRQSVARAVRASMSIPLVYDPVTVGGGVDPTGLLVDGGLTSGFPVTLLDRRDGSPPRWPTFAVRLLPRPRGDGEIPDSNLGLMRAVVDALLDAGDDLEPTTECDERRTVRVDVSHVRAFDLRIEDVDGGALYDAGHDAMQQLLTGWDHDAYLDECRQPR